MNYLCPKCDKSLRFKFLASKQIPNSKQKSLLCPFCTIPLKLNLHKGEKTFSYMAFLILIAIPFVASSDNNIFSLILVLFAAGAFSYRYWLYQKVLKNWSRWTLNKIVEKQSN